MKKALITGGAGFIGYHLSKRLLEDGYRVDLIDNFSRGSNDIELKALLDHPDVGFYDTDLLDPQKLTQLDKNYTHIYHFAAIIGVSNVLDRPYSVLSDNMLMLGNIISFARQTQTLKRLVFTSTSEVYAGTLKHFTLPIPTPESTPLALTDLAHPRTSYMLSKIYGEALCHHSGIPFTIVRPHNIYGPRMGMSHVIPELLKKSYYAHDKDYIDVFSPNHSRTFCYIDDFIEIIKSAAELSSCKNETLNIGNESPEILIGDLARIIINTVGKNLNINAQPETPGSPSRRCPDMKKTLALTGYSAKVTVEEGVMRTFRWYKENVFDS